MNIPLCLSFGAALTVASVLLTHRDGDVHGAARAGDVFVYFPSLCTTPGDSRDCKVIRQDVRPGFASMTACFAYADVELARVNDPRVLASCLRVKEL